MPEKNRPNNWKYLKSSHGFKPFKLTFYGDSENLKRNQIFYHPISDFNAYDGFTAGMRIYNTRVKPLIQTNRMIPESKPMDQQMQGIMGSGTNY